MTDRELDALVAEKVMGWKLVRHKGGESCQSGRCGSHGSAEDGWECFHRPSGETGWASDSPFSADIAAAFLVVEAMRAKGFVCAYFAMIGNGEMAVQVGADPNVFGWSAQFTRGAMAAEYVVQADSLPRAICLAALRALGVST